MLFPGAFVRNAAVLLCSLGVFASSATAQNKGLSLGDVESLLSGGVSEQRILDQSNRDCLDFKVSAESDVRLQRAGASTVLISALHSVCRTGSAKRVTTVVPPRPKTIVKYDTVVVPSAIKHDTIVREIPVRTDPAAPLKNYVNEDARPDNGLQTQTEGDCTEQLDVGVDRILGHTGRLCEWIINVQVPAAVRLEGTFSESGADGH
jgi:hypothetical protein